MALRIPEEDTPAISAIQTLSARSTDELISAINSAPLTADLGTLAKSIAPKVPWIPAERLRHVLETLYTLYYIRETSGVNRATFLEDVVDSIQHSSAKVAKKDISKLRSIFKKILDIEAFNTVSKAARLQRDGERLYCDAKILSDIRPVFRSSPTARPVAAVVTHTLKVGYHEGSDHKEFHVILDSGDLVALSELVGRAMAKDKTLRGLLEDAKLPDLSS
jgi:hypothetical protein